jgi:membrane protein YqaA with SNARE-associated domain
VGATWLLAAGYFGLAVVSALVPWVNAEVLMISAVPVAGSTGALAGLVVAVSAGQMIGKSAMYWLSRSSTRPLSPRWQRLTDGWRERFGARPRLALGMTFVSAVFGVPPFFITSMAVGALHLAFARFLVVGTAGRLVHFSLVAFLPDMLRRTQ